MTHSARYEDDKIEYIIFHYESTDRIHLRVSGKYVHHEGYLSEEEAEEWIEELEENDNIEKVYTSDFFKRGEE